MSALSVRGLSAGYPPRRAGEAPTTVLEDIDLIELTDDPARVVEAIFDFYQTRGFDTTSEEHQSLLYL